MKMPVLRPLCNFLFAVSCTFAPLHAAGAGRQSNAAAMNIAKAAGQQVKRSAVVSGAAVSSKLNDNGESAQSADLARPLDPVLAPDLFNGMMTTSIPLEVPSGRGLIKPDLKLTYRSASANGWLGVGWNIDPGAIQRSTHFGVAFNCPENQVDRPCFEFTSDGANQPIVRVLSGEFRFRVNDSGARIRKLSTGAGLVYWELTDKRGTRYSFGSTLDSQQESSGNVFKWALDRVEDTHGNFMVLRYTKQSGQLYLEEINYAGNRDVSPQNKIRFTLSGRNDTSEMFSSGFSVDTRQRLAFIDVSSMNFFVRRYELGYSDSVASGRSLLTSVTQRGRDGNILPPVRLSYQGENPSWAPGPTPWPKSIHAGGNPPWPAPAVKAQVRNQCMPGDFNGDGKMDIACYTGSSWAVALSTSRGWDTTIWPSGANSGPIVGNPVTAQCITGDFDGDGNTDFACYTGTPTVWHVALSNGSTWHGSPWKGGPPVNLFPGQTVTNVTYRCVAGDFDGDGKSDLACSDGNQSRRWYVSLSSGSRWKSTVPWDGPLAPIVVTLACFVADFNGDGRADLACPSDRPGLWDLAFSTGSSWRTVQRPGPPGTNCVVADFNGDGIADIACYDKASGWNVGLGTGDGWNIVPWGAAPNPINHVPERHINGCYTGDFNGDGRADIVCNILEYTSGGALVRQYWDVGLSTGHSFRSAEWDSPNFTLDPQKCFDGDLTGTGKAGIVCQQSFGVWNALLAGGPAPDLLQQISSPLGAQTRVSYDSTAALYPSPHSGLPFPISVVSSIESGDGRGTWSTKALSYTGGLYDTPSRELRGFAQVTSVEPTQSSTDQVRIEYSFHQGTEAPAPNNDFTGLIGRLARTKTMGPHNELLADQTFAYRENGGTVPLFNPIAQIDTLTCDGATCPKHSILKFGYEENYGNVVREERIADVADRSQDVLVERAFMHDDGSWVVGLSAKETISRPLAAGNEVAALIEYGYDQYRDCGSLEPSIPHIEGNLTTVRRWTVAQKFSDSRFSYDPFGNLTCQREPNGGVSRTTYEDIFHSLPTSVVNSLNQRTAVAYYGLDGVASPAGLIGQVQSVIDSNQAVSAYEYDEFGRLHTQTLPNGARSSWLYLSVGNPGQQNLRVEDPNGLVSSSYFDGFGRTWRTRSSGPDNQTLVRDTVYNTRGTVKEISLPYYQGKENPASTQFAYDSLLRLVRTDRPDGTLITRCYNVWSTATVDENGHLRMDYQDGYGRLSRVEMYPGKYADCGHTQTLPAAYSVTSYTYNALGLLSTYEDANRSKTTLSYDGRGLMTQIVSPESGAWTYAYDANGNLESQADAENRAVYLRYDALNRVVQKDYLTKRSMGKGDFVITYDTGINGIGRLATLREHGHKTNLSYDKLGRVTKRSRVALLRTLSTSVAYDAGGRLTSLRYPTGRVVKYKYNGPLVSGIGLDDGQEITKSDFDALGRARTILLPNGITEKYEFDRKDNPACMREDFRLCSIAFADVSGAMHGKFSYEYDPKGNVKSVEEGDGQKLTAEYDDYDRLLSVTATHPLAGYPQQFKYDPLGNITFNSRVGVYRYGPYGSQPYAMTDAGKYHFAYDRNGNVSRDEYRKYTYDADGRPIKIVAQRPVGGWLSFLFSKTTTSTIEYGYGGDRELKKETRSLPYPLNWLWPRKATTFIDRIAECHGSRCDDYVLVNGPPVAVMRANKKHVAFMVADNLGSSRLVADSEGKNIVSMEFLALGELLSKSGRDKDDAEQRFAGASFDDSTQLYAFDFRYYDPLVGRFITPDPDREPVQKPDRLNRYSYVANNPLTLMDPLGLSGADPNEIDTVSDNTLTYHAVQTLPVTYVEAPPVKSTEGEDGASSGNGNFGFWNGGFDRLPRVNTANNKLTVNYFGGQWGHIGNAINSGQSLGLYPAGSMPFLPSVGAPFLTEGRFAADAEMQGAGPTISVTFRINAAQAARAERAIRDIQVDPSNFNALTNNCTTSTESVLRAAGIANVPTTIFPVQLIRELSERNDVTVTFPHPSQTSIQLVPK